MLGRVVGNFKITGEIGTGGVAEVYSAVHLILERPVAIKVLKPELANLPHLVARFRSEAVTLAKLNHRNIATVYAFFRDGNDLFLVMEFVQGWSLQNIISARGALSLGFVRDIFVQTLDGIAFAHKHGIIHRDIKPANVMLAEDGIVKVMDFGLARALGSARLTRSGHLVGTLEYMPPEQICGAETDVRSDIYSLGILLYELVTGIVPFASDSEYELMRCQMEALPAPPTDKMPHVPAPLEGAILRALEKKPDRRFQCIEDFAEALAHCWSDIPSDPRHLQAIVDAMDKAPERGPSGPTRIASTPYLETRLTPDPSNRTWEYAGQKPTRLAEKKAATSAVPTKPRTIKRIVPALGFSLLAAFFLLAIGLLYFGGQPVAPGFMYIADGLRESVAPDPAPPAPDFRTVTSKPVPDIPDGGPGQGYKTKRALSSLPRRQRADRVAATKDPEVTAYSDLEGLNSQRSTKPTKVGEGGGRARREGSRNVGALPELKKAVAVPPPRASKPRHYPDYALESLTASHSAIQKTKRKTRASKVLGRSKRAALERVESIPPPLGAIADDQAPLQITRARDLAPSSTRRVSDSLEPRRMSHPNTTFKSTELPPAPVTAEEIQAEQEEPQDVTIIAPEDYEEPAKYDEPKVEDPDTGWTITGPHEEHEENKVDDGDTGWIITR